LEAEQAEANAEEGYARQQRAAREAAQAAELQRTQDAVDKAIASALAEFQRQEEARIALWMQEEERKRAEREEEKRLAVEAQKA
jgi:hypothetical protein